MRCVVVVILLASIMAQACAAATRPATTASASNTKPARYVVAHWLIPMKYRAVQSEPQAMEDDVRAAMELGLDGFALNMFSGNQAQWIMRDFIKTADSIGAQEFKVFLSADMSQKFKPEDIVKIVETYGDNPHYLKINGKPLLSTYGGWGLGNEWWEENVLRPLRQSGHEVTFIPYFDRANPNGDPPSYDNWMKVIHDYPSANGLFNFLMPGSAPFYNEDPNLGRHWWSTLVAEENLSRALHDSGKLFMAPYMPYYWAVCHSARQYIEHQGGRGMDNYWRSIIEKQKPEIVEIVTWNDYSESTYIQPTRIPYTKTRNIPSEPHLGYYELLKYYISWYKAGREPRIAKDAMFAFHRLQQAGAAPTNDRAACWMGPVAQTQRWGKIDDVIYLTTALTEPAKIEYTHHNDKTVYDVPQGLNTIEIPFLPGNQSLVMTRSGKVIAKINNIEIVETPDKYNFNVTSRFVSSGGTDSETWLPNDDWRRGFIADWFVP